MVKYTTLYNTTLRYTTLHYATLRCTIIHYSALCYAILHYTTLRYTIQYYNILYYKLEGRGFDSNGIFRLFIYILVPASIWPWSWLSLYHKWVPGIFPVG